MNTLLRVLIVEDSEDDALLLLRELRKGGYEPEWERVDTAEAMKHALVEGKWDLILSDYSMPGFSGISALNMLKESKLDLPFIVVSGKIGEETAVQLMKAGAHDYVAKSNLSRLVPAIEREMTEAKDRCKRRQAEEALRESEGRYRRLLESVTNYVYTVQVDNGRPVATSHSPGCTAVSGYTPEEYAVDPDLWLRMVHEDDRQAVLDQAGQVIAGMMPPPIEHRIINKDGRICWIQNTPVPRRDLEGGLIAYDGIVADITERKQAEEAIIKAKEEWERTFDAITDPVMILDTNYRISKANKAMADKLGVSQFETVGLTCYRVVHGMEEPPHYCPNTRLLADGQPHSTEMNEPRIGGNFFIAVSPTYDQTGNLSGCVHYAREINEQKALEAQLFHAQKMEAVGQLAGGIAHDFNNILTAIIGFSNLLEMGMNKDDPLREHVNHVLASADRAADLTRSLLAFSRKQVIDLQAVNLNELIERIRKFLQRIIGEDIELKTSYCKDTLTVNADSGQIEQVLMNLATNARDAMPNGGRLSIEAQPLEMEVDFIKAHGYGIQGDYALISITDTGVGMDETTRKRLFEPFFTTKEIGKGTGLGLSIVYGIIKQHNGYINVYSEQGVGTTFTIYLPLIKKVAKEKSEIACEPPGKGTETILIADDDPTLRELLEKILGQFGYTVITATDGNDAIQKFRQNSDKIALVILDTIMPNTNGKDAFEQIRMIRPDIRSIFISGYTADIIHKRGMLDEGLEVLAKPLRPLTLLKKVREVLDRTN
jgi:two-component system, cell cycle sensor histidine kinase and response regulator CckA